MLSSRSITKFRDALAQDHTVTPYYQEAEAEGLIKIFWSEEGLFRPRFDQLDLTAIVDLACGHGRHTAQFAERAGRVTLVDVVQGNLDACQQRFLGRKNLRYVRNNGRDLKAIKSGSQTALFSYDAIVHFEFADVLAYLPEIYRVLAPGGRSLLHYSANDVEPAASYRDHPRWRNFGSHPTLLHFANRVGFNLLDQFTTNWPPGNKEPAIDGVALLEKPRA